MAALVDFIKTFGGVEELAPWPDYSAQAYSEADIDNLIGMVADAHLYMSLSDQIASWIPLHAWRALGQIKNSRAIAPLIAEFNNLHEDDWAFIELPQVLAMFGEAAIQPLAEHMAAKDSAEFARAMSLEALVLIQQADASLKPQVQAALGDYLAAANKAHTAFNALLVGEALDLQLASLLPAIEILYAEGAVDADVCGPLDFIQQQLTSVQSANESSAARPDAVAPALEQVDPPKSNKSEPKPEPKSKAQKRREKKAHRAAKKAERAAEVKATDGAAAEQEEQELKKPSNPDDVIGLLDYYFARYGTEQSVCSCSELDGFCHALASAPNVIEPDKWQAAIWGVEQGGALPEWEAKTDAAEFDELVFSIYNHALENLGYKGAEPLFYEPEADGKNYDIANEWCAGFLRGGALWDEVDEADAEVVAEPVELIKLFATEEGFAKLDTMTAAEVAKAQQQVIDGVNQIYRHFYALRNKPQVRETPKVGRNDPCPCGSGKKFKKCCGK